MKYLFALLLLVVGCTPRTAMTNDEIIKEVAKCNAAHLRSVIIYHGWTGMPVAVICVPVEK